MSYSRFYVVSCPYCGVPAGQSCLNVRALLRDGARIWTEPHVDRRWAAVNKSRLVGFEYHGGEVRSYNPMEKADG